MVLGLNTKKFRLAGLLGLGSLSACFVLSGCFGSGTRPDNLETEASKEISKMNLPSQHDSRTPTPKISTPPLPPNTIGNQNYTNQIPTEHYRQQSPSIMEMQQAEEQRREKDRQNAQMQQLQQEDPNKQWKQEEQQRQQEQQRRFQETSRESHLQDLQAAQREDIKNLQRKNNYIDNSNGSPGFKAFQKDVARKDFERHQESRNKQLTDMKNNRDRLGGF